MPCGERVSCLTPLQPIFIQALALNVQELCQILKTKTKTRLFKRLKWTSVINSRLDEIMRSCFSTSSPGTCKAEGRSSLAGREGPFPPPTSIPNHQNLISQMS